MSMPGTISESRIRTVCLVFLSAVAATYLIFWLRPVLVPLVVAFFVVSGVSPILAMLERRLGVKRIVAAALTFLAGVMVLIVFGFSIGASALEVHRNSEAYLKRVRVLVLEIGDLLPAGLFRHDRESQGGQLKTLFGEEEDDSEDTTEPAKLESSQSPPQLPDAPVVGQDVSAETGVRSQTNANANAEADVNANTQTDANTGANAEAGVQSGAEANAETGGNAEADAEQEATAPESPAISTGIPSEDSSLTAPLIDHDSLADSKAQAKLDRASELVDSVLRDAIASLSQTLLGLVSTSVVVLIYVFFLLLGTPSVAKSPAVREIDTQVRSYLSVKTVISIFTGLAFGITLRLFGVPMAFTFGVLAFLLNFVPNVGPLVASLLPVPLIIFDPTGSVGWMVATIVSISTIQMVSGNVIEPKIMGDSSGLHPVTILVALMFWGMMWGVIGMFLATPITAALKIMLERFDSTRFISELMAGRWEGTPSETSESVAS